MASNLNKKKQLKKGSGGARKGAGRPKKEPTTTLSYRVPVKHRTELDSEIRKLIANKISKNE